jgi:PAS domain S-box-containing protein
MLSNTPIDATSAITPDITIDNCASEPIRIPGSIQPHGFLLMLDENYDHVIVASQSAAEVLVTPLKLILGAPIRSLFQRELLMAIEHQHCASVPDGMVSYLGSFSLNGEMYSLVTHCVEGKPMLEFERQDRLVGAEMMNSVITNFVSTLSRLETQEDLCEAVTRQVAVMTGFDRVLLYSFDEEGHGTVLSEANNGLLPSYLDLRFPASDIPAQARELYVLNTVRIIPNASYTPSPLERVASEAPHILDLSLSVLRSVSPIHVEYMRNMGTLSSMSISIVSEGRLWGLISGHHSEPRMVPYLVRSACDMLSKLVGTQLTAFRAAARLRTAMHFHGVQRQLLTYVAAANNYLSELALHMLEVQQVTDASGVALWLEGRCELIGRVPAVQDVQRIVEWLDTKPDMELYETRQLSADLPWTADLADTASGMLAIRISDVRQRYVLWFRPQVIRTVRWAGEPASKRDATNHLHPRKSFEIWRETFRGRSQHWSEAEVESAREFLSAMTTISLRRAEEEAELSNARFERLTQALPEKIFTADDDGQLTFTNHRWREQGLTSTGLWFGEGRMVPEDEERLAAKWAEAVPTGHAIEEEIRILSGPDKVPRWNLVRAVPVRRQSGGRGGWVGSVVDLTDRREREAALRMTEKLALTGRMTSVIAHEINNPLESITNLLYLVRLDLPAEGDAVQYITQAESELERIAGITKQTLRWGRENSGKTEKFEAGAIFTDVLRLFRGKLRNRDVHAQVLGGSEVVIEGFIGQIRQVVANLVANAIDAAFVGGKVWIEARNVGGTVEIIVGDDGIGMGPEVRSQLFEPFYTTKGDLGNGLGLYISKEIVERHHGELRVDTAPNQGTTVHVFLPENARIIPLAPSEADLLA